MKIPTNNMMKIIIIQIMNNPLDQKVIVTPTVIVTPIMMRIIIMDSYPPTSQDCMTTITHKPTSNKIILIKMNQTRTLTTSVAIIFVHKNHNSITI